MKFSYSITLAISQLISDIIYNIDVFIKWSIVYVIYILPFSEFCRLCHLSMRRWKANPFVSSSIYIRLLRTETASPLIGRPSCRCVPHHVFMWGHTQSRVPCRCVFSTSLRFHINKISTRNWELFLLSSCEKGAKQTKI